MTGGGFSASATLLGRPDTSQLSLTEMANHYERICEVVDVPFFGDGDTGLAMSLMCHALFGCTSGLG